MKELLQSILLDFPTFTFKARQKYLTEESFKKQRQNLLDKISDQILHKQELQYDLESGINLYKWIMLHYTAGAPVTTIMEMTKVYYFIAKDAFERHGHDLEKLDCGRQLASILRKENKNQKLENEEVGPISALLPYPLAEVSSINPLAIAGFLDSNDLALKSMYLHCCWDIDLTDLNRLDSQEFLRDTFSTYLTNFVITERKDSNFGDLNLNKNNYKKIADDDFLGRHDFFKALHADDPEEVIQHLDNYLKKWILLSRESSLDFEDMFNSHLQEALDFQGYWAFEVALLVHLKNIDDTPFHKYFYYPLDFVKHFRGTQNPVTPAADTYTQFMSETEKIFFHPHNQIKAESTDQDKSFFSRLFQGVLNLIKLK